MNRVQSISSSQAGWLVVGLVCVLCVGCAIEPQYDVILRNGTVYDGSGSPPFVGDVPIDGDVIAAIGDLGRARG